MYCVRTFPCLRGVPNAGVSIFRCIAKINANKYIKIGKRSEGKEFHKKMFETMSEMSETHIFLKFQIKQPVICNLKWRVVSLACICRMCIDICIRTS